MKRETGHTISTNIPLSSHYKHRVFGFNIATLCCGEIHFWYGLFYDFQLDEFKTLLTRFLASGGHKLSISFQFALKERFRFVQRRARTDTCEQVESDLEFMNDLLDLSNM